MSDSNDQKPRLLSLPWFRPVYRRVIVCAIPVLGFLWELFYTHEQFWMLIWAAAFAYGIWTFFIDYENQLKKMGHGKPES